MRDCNIHKLIREIGEDRFYIELIEPYPCNSKEELTAREGYYIRDRGTLNNTIEGRTNKEWRTEDKDKITNQKQQYYKDHIEHKNNNTTKTAKNVYYKGIKIQRTKQRMYITKEQNIQRTKQKYIFQKHKTYRENNKEHINQYANEQITCNICDCQVARANMARHQRTNKCRNIRDTASNISTSVGSAE